MNYKLLVLDLDGTLTDSKKRITTYTHDTLIEAQKQGVKIVLASGRPTYGVAPLANALELDRYEGYILSYNGGEIIDWKTGEVIYKKWLDNDVLPYLYNCATNNRFAIVTYDHEFVLTESPDDEYVLKEALLNVMKIKKGRQLPGSHSPSHHEVPDCGRTGTPCHIGKGNVRKVKGQNGSIPFGTLFSGTGAKRH